MKTFCLECRKIVERRIKDLKLMVRETGAKNAVVTKERMFIIEQLEWLLKNGA